MRWSFPWSTGKESRKHLTCTDPWHRPWKLPTPCNIVMVPRSLDKLESFTACFVSQEQNAAYSHSTQQKLHLPQLPPSRSGIPEVSAEASHRAHSRSLWLEVTSGSRSCVQVMVTLPEANQVPATSASSIDLPGTPLNLLLYSYKLVRNTKSLKNKMHVKRIVTQTEICL